MSPTNKTLSKHIGSNNAIANLKSLNECIDKRFPKINNNDLKK